MHCYQENIDYECFPDRREKEDVDELIELMVEILMMPDDSVVRIGGADKPVSVVKSQFPEADLFPYRVCFVQPAPEYIQSGEHQGISFDYALQFVYDDEPLLSGGSEP